MISGAYRVNNEERVQLRHARAQLRITQKRLAELAELHFNVISDAERGKNISLSSAYAILDALNGVRKEKGLAPLRFADLQWNIRE